MESLAAREISMSTNIQRLPISHSGFLTSGQQTIWLGQQLHPDQPLYEVVYDFGIHGPLDAARFQSAFTEMIDHMPLLRLRAGDHNWTSTEFARTIDTSCPFIELDKATNEREVITQAFIDRKLNQCKRLFDSLLIKVDGKHYRWLLKTHHVLSDAMNGRVFLSEMAKRYFGSRIESHDFFDDNRGDSQGEFSQWWKDRTTSHEGTLFFSSKQSKECVKHHRVCVTLSKEECEAIDSLCQRPPFQQLSPSLGQFNVMATLLMSWLFRVTQQNDVTIGVTNHGRTTLQSRQTLGMYMQLLPFHIALSDDETFASLSRSVAREKFGYLRNCEGNAFQPATQRSFDVALNLIDLSVENFGDFPTEMRWLHNGYGDPHRRLTLSCFKDQSSGLWTWLFDFNCAAFTSEQQSRAVSHLRALMKSMSSSPDLAIGQADYLSAEETRFLELHSGTTSSRSPKQNVWNRICEFAAAKPQSLAVIDDDRELTYRELVDQAQDIADELQQRDCGAIVPIRCQQSANTVVAMLGVLASGRCFCPIDVRLPKLRSDVLIDQCRSNVILESGSSIHIQSLPASSDLYRKGDIPDACYLLHTSGTTGKPNEVLVGEDSLINLLAGFEHLAPLVENSRCCWWTNVGFDVATYEIFSAITNGHSLWILDPSTRMDTKQFFEFLIQKKIQGAYIPPFFLKSFDQYLRQQKTPSSLRRLLVGVEPISQELLASIGQQIPQLKLINGYGPTETTICATLKTIDVTDTSPGNASIGKPVDGNIIRIVDRFLQPVPPGATGELIVGGTGLALGYLQVSDTNKGRFFTDSSDQRCSTWYRTGDWVRMDENGDLHFVGRKDEQLKINGHRIEPQEIASTLKRAPNVSDCAVIANQNHELIGCVAGKKLDEHQLRSFVEQRLPAFMVPNRFVVLEQMPRNNNGKVDQAVLAELIARNSDKIRQIKGPQNATERKLLAIWADVLGEQEICVNDRFFQIGGSSLDAIRIVDQLRQSGFELNIQEFLSLSSIQAVAERVDAIDSVATDAEPSTSPEIKQYQPTPIQRSMWYAARSDPRDRSNHLTIRCDLTGDIELEKLRASIRAISQDHEAFRTRFESVDGEPVAKIDHDANVDLEVHSNQNDIERAIRDYGRTAFDLEAGPLFRFAVFESIDAHSVLVIATHHIVIDEHSILLLLKQLAEHYRSTGRDSERPKHDQSFSDFSLRHHQALAARSDTDVLAEAIAACDLAIDLPRDVHSHQKEPYHGKTVSRHLDAHLIQRIQDFAVSQNASENAVMLSAYQWLLAKYCGSERFTVGVPVSQREAAHQHTYGNFIDALPIPCTTSSTQTFREFVLQTQGQLASLIDHRKTSLADLAKRVDFLRGMRAQPFQTMFVHRQPMPTVNLDQQVRLRPRTVDLETAKFPMTMFVTLDGRQSEVCIEYATDVFSSEAIELVLDHWSCLLQRIADDPNMTLRSLDFGCERDRKTATVLAEEITPCVYHSVTEQIVDQAKTHPDRIAVTDQHQSISYKDLVFRAQSIANDLNSKGIQPGEPVAILCSPSVDAITAILGAMLAGGAYMPLDPNAPSKRVEQILDDAGTRFVLSQRESTQWPNKYEALAVSDYRTMRTRQILTRNHHDLDSIAYIIHTSGTTGAAKGVQVSHRALAESTTARIDFYRQAPKSFLLFSPTWFDSSVAGIFWTLVTGGKLVIPSQIQIQKPTALCQLIRDQQVTHTLCLPSIYQMLLEHGDTHQMKSLSLVIVAGESCSSVVAQSHFKRHANVRLFNEYGPTEASVWATACEMTTHDANRVMTIGKPVSGTPIYVLDRQGKQVPIGVPGEICIGGSRLANGYLHQKALTAEKFVEHVFGERKVRLYHTGDLARIRYDGKLIFLGRSDGQLKINGQRIEAFEIESYLNLHPAVIESACGLTTLQPAVTTDTSNLLDALNELPNELAESLLTEAENHEELEQVAPEEVVCRENDHFEVKVRFKHGGLISPPRDRQRSWLIQQAMKETLADLEALDAHATRMVPGSDKPHLPRDLSTDQLSKQEIMEDWQRPMMQAMSDAITKSGGDILEIGFGRGVSATMIQAASVRSHTIIEMNPHSLNDHFRNWVKGYPQREIRVIEGRWQDVADHLGRFDGIFFHAFPMNENEFVQHVLESSTYAEHFFETASNLLNPGGILTYLSTEIDSLSRQHQRSLFQHFRSISLQVQELNIPQDTRDAWWTNSMVVVSAIK